MNDKIIIDKKNWLSRLKQIFRSYKKKKKINSNMKPERVVSNMDDYYSISNNSKTRSVNSKSSSSKSASFDYERDPELNHSVKLPYERFLTRR